MSLAHVLPSASPSASDALRRIFDGGGLTAASSRPAARFKRRTLLFSAAHLASKASAPSLLRTPTILTGRGWDPYFWCRSLAPPLPRQKSR